MLPGRDILHSVGSRRAFSRLRRCRELAHPRLVQPALEAFFGHGFRMVLVALISLKNGLYLGPIAV